MLGQGSNSRLTGESPGVGRALLSERCCGWSRVHNPLFGYMLEYLGRLVLATDSRRFFIVNENNFEAPEHWRIEDDEVLECGLENPEICESCQ